MRGGEGEGPKQKEPLVQGPRGRTDHKEVEGPKERRWEAFHSCGQLSLCQCGPCPLDLSDSCCWDCWYRRSLETLSGFLSHQTGGQTRPLLPEVPSCSSVQRHTSEATTRCARQTACTLPIYFSCLNEPHRSSHNWFASGDVPTLLLTQVDVLAGPPAAWATMEMQRCWFFWMEKPLSWWSIITPLPRLVRA